MANMFLLLGLIGLVIATIAMSYSTYAHCSAAQYLCVM